MKGSHKCGRIEHSMVAGQTAADINRVRELKKKLELVYVELEPGILNYIVHIQLLTRLKFSKIVSTVKDFKTFNIWLYFYLPMQRIHWKRLLSYLERLHVLYICHIYFNKRKVWTLLTGILQLVGKSTENSLHASENFKLSSLYGRIIWKKFDRSVYVYIFLWMGPRINKLSSIYFNL